MDGLEVREHSAEPAGVDERHADPGSLLLDGLLGLFLGAHEEHRAAPTANVLEEVVGLVQGVECLLEVDYVDAGALPEDESAHLGIPPPGLMAEVDARLEELPPSGDGHGPVPP